jgi:hypothetical protein
MLEYSDYGGRTNTKFSDEWTPPNLVYFPGLDRVYMSFGENHSTINQIDIRNLIEGGYWLGRISLYKTFRGSGNPQLDFLSLYVGSTVEWGASPRMYSENLYGKVGEKIAPIAQQRAYLPRLLRVVPENKALTDTLHKKGEPLTISWQGDENNQKDSIAIVVTNYHANFVTFPHLTTQYPIASTMLGSRKGMVFFPPNRRRITTSAWVDFQDTVIVGGTPTRWYKIVKEEGGKNIFTIPSEVFANAVNGELFDIRCYRWNDIVTDVNPIAYTKEGFEEKWLIGPGAKERDSVRSRLRVVTMSVGRVMIYE